jgi:hypothetical protein
MVAEVEPECVQTKLRRGICLGLGNSTRIVVV